MYRSGQSGDGLITDPDTWKQHKAEFESYSAAVQQEEGQLLLVIGSLVKTRARLEAENLILRR
jgi:hypothetical protein